MDKIDMSGWDLIGTIGVDSGQIMLADPCYVDSFDSKDGDFAHDAIGREKPEHTNFSYAGACNVTLAKDQAGIIGNGLGAVCSSGFGDGSYPVYIKRTNEGSCGDRIGAMMIVFIGDEDEDEDTIEVCEKCGDEMWGFHIGEVCPECEANAETEENDE